MADLFQSEYDVGSLRRGVQDGETLWSILAEDGTIAIVPDPDPDAVTAAQKKLADVDWDDPEEANSPDTKALQRLAAFQAPISAQLPAEDEDEERAGNGRRKQSEEKAEARS